MLHARITFATYDLWVLGDPYRSFLVWLVREGSCTLDCAYLGNRSFRSGPDFGLHVGEYLPRGLLLSSCSFCGMSKPVLTFSVTKTSYAD